MAASRLSAEAADGQSAQASPGPGQLFLCDEGSGSRALPAAQPGKGEPNRTRACAQPRTHRTQSSCTLRGGRARRRRQQTTSRSGSETSAQRPGTPRLLIPRGVAVPPLGAHWLDETSLGGPCLTSRRSRSRPRWSFYLGTPGRGSRLGVLLWGPVFDTFQGSWSDCPRLSLGAGWGQVELTRRWVGWNGQTFRSSELQDHKPSLLIFQMEAEAQGQMGFSWEYTKEP